MSEELELGRVLGGLGKAGFDTKRIRELAKKKKKRVSEVLAEALELYETVSTLEGVDSKCLGVGLALAEHLLTYATRILSEVSRVYTTDMVQHYLGVMAKTLTAQSETSAPETTTQTPTVPTPPDPRTLVMNMVTPLLTMLVNLVSKVAGITVPTQTPTQTSTGSLGIKVVREEEGAKDEHLRGASEQAY